MRALGFLTASILIALAPAIGAADPAQPQPPPPQQTENPAPQPQSTTQQTVATTAPEKVTVIAPSDKVNLDEVVCRPVAPTIGSRLGGGRECHPVRQWNQREREAQDITRKAQVVGYKHY